MATPLSIKLNKLFQLILQDISSSKSFEQIIVEIDKHFDMLDKKQNEFSKKDNLDLTLAKISSLLINCNKENCFTKAKKAIEYLKHQSPVIKSFACYTVCFFIKIITLFTINEKLPEKRNRYLSHLNTMIEEISHFLSSNSLPKDQNEKIQESIRFAEIATITNGFSESKMVKCSDEALESIIESSIRRLFKNIDINRIENLIKEEEIIIKDK